MNEIITEKKELEIELRKFQKRMYEIEVKLIDLEKTLADYDNIEILNKMELNDQQREIVEAEHKNILVIACPGSGKTHTLISRYIYLVVKKNVDPEKIILITFTNKAGKEMAERIHKYLPNKKPHYVGSLHGLSYRLLQKYNKINYTIIDEKDYKNILKLACQSCFETSELNDDEENFIITQISNIYEKVSTDYPLNINNTLDQLNINKKFKTVINKILKKYKKIKEEQLLLDFNDLMSMLCDLLNKNKLDGFLDNIEYIFFDEYQDINPIQNYILSKFNNKSNIMVVGDDAQAIYAFRGSNIKYIRDFNKNFGSESEVLTKYLETNYRSTKKIIDLSQDVISHNTNQYNKNVKSNNNDKGLKPQIICFPRPIEQNEWVVKDIVTKYHDGISLNDMVILARTNRSLQDIELELVKFKIPISKSLGRNILDKTHIKDFIAFLIVITNDKSLFHWKRILALHRNIGVQKANYIIENNNNILKSLEELTNSSDFFNQNLSDFYLLLKDLNNNRTLVQKIHLVQLYLRNLYKNKGDYNYETKMEDIVNLTSYFGETSIEEFISNVYLDDFEDCNMDEVLYLSTVHGAKGLEWKYVYIIDVDSTKFPVIRENYYLTELNNCEEERRLFYVATSRAKKELTITYFENIQSSDRSSIKISPFIKELNQKNYLGHGIQFGTQRYTGIISEDVKNYIRFNGLKDLSVITSLDHNRTNINTFCKTELPIPNGLKFRFIIGNFMDYLVAKMIQVNFPDKIYKFELNLVNRYPKFPKHYHQKYIDKLSDWRDMLDDIFDISTYSVKNMDNVLLEYKQYLINTNTMDYYLKLEKSIIKYVKKLKPQKIQCHYNISYSNFKAECDILIDDELFELKTSYGEACTISNICQVLLYGYLLHKKQIKINKVHLYNIYNGTFDTFNTKDFSFKDFKKEIYK